MHHLWQLYMCERESGESGGKAEHREGGGKGGKEGEKKEGRTQVSALLPPLLVDLFPKVKARVLQTAHVTHAHHSVLSTAVEAVCWGEWVQSQLVCPAVVLPQQGLDHRAGGRSLG